MALNQEERQFVDAVLEHKDFGKVCEVLGWEKDYAREVERRDWVRKALMKSLLASEVKWTQLTLVAKRTLMDAMSSPDVTWKDKLNAAKIACDVGMKVNPHLLAEVGREGMEKGEAASVVLGESKTVN